MELFCPECGRGFDGDDGPDCPEDDSTLLSTEETDHPLVGELIQDRFRPIDVLGEGGAGTVFRAVQRPIGREVAVKVLSDKLRDDNTSYDRFFREAKLASSLRHPNIVSPVDFGEDEDHGVVFFAMEYVDGIDVYDLLEEHRVTVPLALEIVHQTCGALTDAHAQGIIHRDLKPRNLRLTVISDGSIQVKTLDLGVARPLESTQDLTQEDNLAGTTSYLPPEYILEGDLGTYSDLYSLGIIFFEMLTGQKPFSGKRMQVMFHHIRTSPPSINDTLPNGETVPDVIESFYRQLVEKHPGERIGSAQEARAMVEKLRSELDVDSVELDDPSSKARIDTFEPWLEESMPTIEDVESISSGFISDLRGAGAQIEETSGSDGPRVHLPTPPPLPAHDQKSEPSDHGESEESNSRGFSLPTPGGADADDDQSSSKPSSAPDASDLLGKLTSGTEDDPPDSDDDTPDTQELGLDDVEVDDDLSEASDGSSDESDDEDQDDTPSTQEIGLDDVEVEDDLSESSDESIDEPEDEDSEKSDDEPREKSDDEPGTAAIGADEGSEKDVGDEPQPSPVDESPAALAAGGGEFDRKQLVAVAAAIALVVFGGFGIFALLSSDSEPSQTSEAVAAESDESEETSDEPSEPESAVDEPDPENEARELAESTATSVIDESHIVGAAFVLAQDQQQDPDVDAMRSAAASEPTGSTDRRSAGDRGGGDEDDTDDEPQDELDRLLEQAGTP